MISTAESTGVRKACRALRLGLALVVLGRRPDLWQLDRQQPADAPPLLLRLALEIAAGLAFLHRNGIIHRDVKAANICLHADLTPALIDCGLAKHVPAEVGGPQTSTGGRFGTPGYMCSRYANGGAFDERSEAYSFGIVLLELIVGEVQMPCEWGNDDRRDTDRRSCLG